MQGLGLGLGLGVFEGVGQSRDLGLFGRQALPQGLGGGGGLGEGGGGDEGALGPGREGMRMVFLPFHGSFNCRTWKGILEARIFGERSFRTGGPGVGRIALCALSCSAFPPGATS